MKMRKALNHILDTGDCYEGTRKLITCKECPCHDVCLNQTKYSTHLSYSIALRTSARDKLSKIELQEAIDEELQK